MNRDDDEFFSGLGKNWRSEAPDLSISRRAVRRAQWHMKLEKAVQAVAVMICWVTAVIFWLRGAPLVNRVSAVVMLGTGGVILASLILQHRRLLRWEDYSPQGLVRFRLDSLRGQIRDLHYGIGSCLFLLLFTAALWLMRFFLPGSVPDFFPLFYSLLTVPLALGLIVLFRRMIHRKEARRHAMERLCDE